jgi:hypothetical protein
MLILLQIVLGTCFRQYRECVWGDLYVLIMVCVPQSFWQLGLKGGRGWSRMCGVHVHISQVQGVVHGCTQAGMLWLGWYHVGMFTDGSCLTGFSEARLVETGMHAGEIVKGFKHGMYLNNLFGVR